MSTRPKLRSNFAFLFFVSSEIFWPGNFFSKMNTIAWREKLKRESNSGINSSGFDSWSGKNNKRASVLSGGIFFEENSSLICPLWGLKEKPQLVEQSIRRL